MGNRFLEASSVIESLRDNGYINSAYALAELIDNSLQAAAERVELGFIEEQQSKSGKRAQYAVSAITLWDNGIGMNSETLSKAMKFGGGTHRNDPKGMGKFGMGLPNSSISQCKRVEVWSWQNSKTPHYTYLDVDEMISGDLEDVPIPVENEIPEQYREAFFDNLPSSGTLVIWSKLDRLSWKTGKSIYRHCEHLVGRMYRNFISDENIKIETSTYRKSDKNTLEIWGEKETFKANDPMYLTKNTSLPDLPGNYKNEAFFELDNEEFISIEYMDDSGELKRDDVRIRSSIIKSSILKKILKNTSGYLGRTPWGSHCKKNVGVSIVRADRELVLRDSFLNATLRENKGRYVGVEVSFPPTLDKVFGVTNNKQDAVKLVNYDLSALAEQAGLSHENEYKRELADNNDSLLEVLKVTDAISAQITTLTGKLKGINTEGTGTGGTSPETTNEGAASKATAGSLDRENHGHKTGTISPKLKKKDVVDHLKTSGGMSQQEAEEKAERLILSGNRFLIEDVARDSDAFFDVATSKGLTLVLFNTNHVFYKELVSKLGDDELEVMQTTIAGFARVMNETKEGPRKDFLNVIRREWGIVISKFLETSNDF